MESEDFEDLFDLHEDVPHSSWDTLVGAAGKLTTVDVDSGDELMLDYWSQKGAFEAFDTASLPGSLAGKEVTQNFSHRTQVEMCNYIRPATFTKQADYDTASPHRIIRSIPASSQDTLVKTAGNLATDKSEDESMLDCWSQAARQETHQTSVQPLSNGGNTQIAQVAPQDLGNDSCASVDPATSTAKGDQNVGSAPAVVSNSPPTVPPASLSVINKIEAVFEQMADDMLNERGELSILLKTRQAKKTVAQNPGPSTVSHEAGGLRYKKIGFPGKTAEEAWRFMVTRLLEMMHEALLSGAVITKRDMYYRDQALFGNQTHVDRYVDDIALTFGVPRSLLNVTAAAKGLIIGAATFCRKDGSSLDVSTDRDGTLVPSLRDILAVNLKAVDWILVIEKEASFRSIAASSFWPALSQHGIMVTGKGYPDVATRALLHFMATPSSKNGYASPPVYGVMDFDPDGLAILNTYKFGSAKLTHEGPELCVPGVRWLGLKSEHVVLDAEDLHASQGLLALSQRDRRKAVKMLESSDGNDDVDAQETRSELQMMLMLNVKAELQLLHATTGGMETLLTSVFENGDAGMAM